MRLIRPKATFTGSTNVQEPGFEPRATTCASRRSLRIQILARGLGTRGRKGGGEVIAATTVRPRASGQGGGGRGASPPARRPCDRQLRRLSTFARRGCPIANGRRRGCPIANGRRRYPIANGRRSSPIANVGLS